MMYASYLENDHDESKAYQKIRKQTARDDKDTARARPNVEEMDLFQKMR